MLETPFFFEHGPARLFAVWHEPDQGPRRHPFVFCHPFGEEKLWAHRTYVTFARALAERGYPVLRFDHQGNGDSSGRFSDSSLATARDDVSAAIAVARSRAGTNRIGLLGLRLGASLAFRAAASRDDVESLVLWAPIISGERYLQELLRINLTTQMAVYREIREDREALGRVLAAGGTVNVDGYEIAGAMAADLGALTLLGDADAMPAARTYIAQIERSPAAKPAADVAALAGRLSAATLEVVQEDPFWKEIQRFYDRAPNLFAATLAWLEHAGASAETTQRG